MGREWGFVTLAFAMTSVLLTAAPAQASLMHAPAGLVGYAGEEGNILHWNAPLAGSVANYLVHRQQAGEDRTFEVAADQTSFVDTTRTIGTATYTVTAVTMGGQESESNPVAVYSSQQGADAESSGCPLIPVMVLGLQVWVFWDCLYFAPGNWPRCIPLNDSAPFTPLREDCIFPIGI